MRSLKARTANRNKLINFAMVLLVQVVLLIFYFFVFIPFEYNKYLLYLNNDFFQIAYITDNQENLSMINDELIDTHKRIITEAQTFINNSSFSTDNVSTNLLAYYNKHLQLLENFESIFELSKYIEDTENQFNQITISSDNFAENIEKLISQLKKLQQNLSNTQNELSAFENSSSQIKLIQESIDKYYITLSSYISELIFLTERSSQEYSKQEITNLRTSVKKISETNQKYQLNLLQIQDEINLAMQTNSTWQDNLIEEITNIKAVIIEQLQ